MLSSPPGDEVSRNLTGCSCNRPGNHHDAKKKKTSEPVPLYASCPLGDKTAVNTGRAAGTVRVQKGLETLGLVLAQKPKCQVLCVGLVATLTGKVGNPSACSVEVAGKGGCPHLRKTGVKGVLPRCAGGGGPALPPLSSNGALVFIFLKRFNCSSGVLNLTFVFSGACNLVRFIN